MLHPRTVMIVHPDSEKRRALCALVRNQRVVEAESRQQAVALLSELRPSSVVSHHDDFKKLVRDLERHAPGASRAVLLPSNDDGARESLIDVAALGYDFQTIDEREAEAVRTFLDGRTSTRLEPQVPLTATFTVDDRRMSCPVSDVSNDGLGLHLGPGAPLERLVPGAKLIDAVVEGPHGVAMQARTWVVQTVVASLTGRGIHLGVSVDVPRRDASARVAIDDEVRIRGLIRRAVARGTRFMASLATGAEPRSYASLAVEPAGGSLALRGARIEWPAVAGELVLVSFELAGHQTEFLTVAHEARGRDLVLAFPRRIAWRSRRASLRVPLDEDERAVLQVSSPLHPKTGLKRLLDLHPSGAAFLYDAQHEAFPPGLLLKVVLSVGGREIAADAVVQGSAAVEREGVEDGTQRRCGLKLEGLSDVDRQFLLDLLVRSLVPEVEDASGLPFSDIWKLFVEQQVKFPDYPTGDPKTLETLSRSHELLGDGRHGLSKAFVHRHEGELVGHVSGLRIYSRTWLSQHLLVRSGYHRQTHVSQSLVNLSFHYGEALPDLEYLRGLWRASNRWSSRTFGTVIAKLMVPGRTALWTYSPMRRLAAEALPRPEVEARAASPEDEVALLAHLAETRDPLHLRACDLVAGEMHLESLGRRYAASGLERSRTIGVVHGPGGPRGWVACEDSTDGLFWAEMYNAARLFVPEPDAPDAPDVFLALAAFAQADALKRRRRWVELLADEPYVAPVQRFGFTNLGSVFQFDLHRDMAREVTLQMGAAFERLSEREGRAAARQEEAK